MHHGAAFGDVRNSDGKCEIWRASRDRSPPTIFSKRSASRREFTVNVTLLGGAFGRKSMPDFGVEAAVLSKAMGGEPVKVVWTREDDLHNGYFHTVSVEHLEAGLDASGSPSPGAITASRRPSCRPSTPIASKKRMEAGIGSSTCPSIRQSAHRERRRGAHEHRLVPLGLEYPACIRHPVLRRRTRRGGREGSEGLYFSS